MLDIQPYWYVYVAFFVTFALWVVIVFLRIRADNKEQGKIIEKLDDILKAIKNIKGDNGGKDGKTEL
jgi:TRAP-type C4-dicarboxylate transport system permease small subunit